MNLGSLSQHPHLRFNPLLRSWVQVSPNRLDRPWRGQIETNPVPPITLFDPECYLCPGNTRAGGLKNPHYENTFAFDNDFPALLPSAPELAFDDSGLLVARTEAGICRVLCFSPRHDLTLARMTELDICSVVDAWTEEYAALLLRPGIKYVTIFENRGVMMGASNPHPHGQIWATATVPNEPATEAESMAAYREQYGECLLCAYVKAETRANDRLICENERFAVVVPFWAAWPFETLVVSKQHLGGMDELDTQTRMELASILKQITVRYDHIFETPFPYSMGFHQRSIHGKAHVESHLHAHFYPPLLRSATIRKFMVGFEMLGTPQRDFSPEVAASRLREAGKAPA